MQNSLAELPLTLLMFVLSFYGETLAMRNSFVLWPTIALQAPLYWQSNIYTYVFRVARNKLQILEVWYCYIR